MTCIKEFLHKTQLFRFAGTGTDRPAFNHREDQCAGPASLYNHKGWKARRMRPPNRVVRSRWTRTRAQYHDSYEYFAADWTPSLLEEFAARRGYDLRSQMPALFGQGEADLVARVKADYRQTMSELHLAFLRQWAGGLARRVS